MNKLLILLVLLIASGCSHAIKEPAQIDESYTVRISPDYEASGISEGLRVHTYGEHTLVKSMESFKAWDTNNLTLNFEKIGHYFRSEYLLNDFFIKRGDKLAHIKRVFIPKEPEAPIFIEIKAAPKPEPIKHYPALEEYSLKKLNILQTQLDQLSAIPATTGADLFHAQVKQNKVKQSLKNHQPVVFVHFNYGQTDFIPDIELIKALIPAAKTASEINLRGRTDSRKASKADYWIAKQRAENAKNFLIKKGVNPEIITLGYLPEGNFLLPPTPKKSKAVNRRVEIEVKP